MVSSKKTFFMKVDAMTLATISKNILPPHKFNEPIIVVKREFLFKNGTWQGIKQVDFTDYLALVQQNQESMLRGLAEENFEYKQIIPYLIFRHNNLYFLMQRKSNSSEQRLANKYSLGIGGHLRTEDLKGTTLFEWAEREFKEEISYKGNFTITPLGILNLDTTPVEKVHIGFVLLLEGDSADIHIKSELQSGALVSLEACKKVDLEQWSALVIEHLDKTNI